MLTATEGTTKEIDVQLQEKSPAGVVSNLDGSGFSATVSLYMRGVDDQLVDTTGKVAWLVQASGTVRFSPAATDLKANKIPYRLKFEVTDGSAKTRCYPQGDPLLLQVYPKP